MATVRDPTSGVYLDTLFSQKRLRTPAIASVKTLEESPSATLALEKEVICTVRDLKRRYVDLVRQLAENLKGTRQMFETDKS